VGPVKRQISRHAAPLRRESTDAERLLWSRLRDRRLNGWKFRRQHTIGPFIADFVCLELMMIVEADGGQHSEEADASRTAYLRRQGFRVVRYWNNDILQNLDGVLEHLASLLGDQATSSPAYGRGGTQA
jgi:very-short-patch-repair endonuclease